MDLRALRYFSAVAEELHFGRAAKRLHISQPPLSRQIRNLEEELGVPLFYRSRRHVQLTPAGELFLHETRSLLTAVEEAANAARRAGRGEIGRIVIGFFLGATYRLLPTILSRYRVHSPNVKLVLQDMEQPNVLDALVRGSIDVGFFRPPNSHPTVRTEVLLREPFVAAIPAENPIAKRRVISLQDLAEEPFVMYPSRSVLYSQIMTACHKAGFHPRVVQEAVRPETILGLVRAGAGIALVASSVRMRSDRAVVFREIKGPLPMTEIAIAWRIKHVPPVVKSFLDCARQAMRGAA